MIKGKRISLKPLREEDVPLYASMLADPDMMGEYITARMASETAVKKRFSETGLFDEEGGRLLIWLGERIIGTVVYFKEPAYYNGYEMGYILWDLESRRQGYTTEAVLLLADYLFKIRPINRLQLVITVGNEASARVAQKAGFTLEGVARGAIFINGRNQDVQIFSLLRSEWTPQ
jgi:RimJ/RimL family protein N-acetyltransferase